MPSTLPFHRKSTRTILLHPNMNNYKLEQTQLAKCHVMIMFISTILHVFSGIAIHNCYSSSHTSNRDIETLVSLNVMPKNVNCCTFHILQTTVKLIGGGQCVTGNNEGSDGLNGGTLNLREKSNNNSLHLRSADVMCQPYPGGGAAYHSRPDGTEFSVSAEIPTSPGVRCGGLCRLPRKPYTQDVSRQSPDHAAVSAQDFSQVKCEIRVHVDLTPAKDRVTEQMYEEGTAVALDDFMIVDVWYQCIVTVRPPSKLIMHGGDICIISTRQRGPYYLIRDHVGRLSVNHYDLAGAAHRIINFVPQYEFLRNRRYNVTQWMPCYTLTLPMYFLFLFHVNLEPLCGRADATETPDVKGPWVTSERSGRLEIGGCLQHPETSRDKGAHDYWEVKSSQFAKVKCVCWKGIVNIDWLTYGTRSPMIQYGYSHPRYNRACKLRCGASVVGTSFQTGVKEPIYSFISCVGISGHLNSRQGSSHRTQLSPEVCIHDKFMGLLRGDKVATTKYRKIAGAANESIEYILRVLKTAQSSRDGADLNNSSYLSEPVRAIQYTPRCQCWYGSLHMYRYIRCRRLRHVNCIILIIEHPRKYENFCFSFHNTKGSMRWWRKVEEIPGTEDSRDTYGTRTRVEVLLRNPHPDARRDKGATGFCGLTSVRQHIKAKCYDMIREYNCNHGSRLVPLGQSFAHNNNNTRRSIICSAANLFMLRELTKMKVNGCLEQEVRISYKSYSCWVYCDPLAQASGSTVYTDVHSVNYSCNSNKTYILVKIDTEPVSREAGTGSGCRHMLHRVEGCRQEHRKRCASLFLCVIMNLYLGSISKICLFVISQCKEPKCLGNYTCCDIYHRNDPVSADITAYTNLAQDNANASSHVNGNLLTRRKSDFRVVNLHDTSTDVDMRVMVKCYNDCWRISPSMERNIYSLQIYILVCVLKWCAIGYSRWTILQGFCMLKRLSAHPLESSSTLHCKMRLLQNPIHKMHMYDNEAMIRSRHISCDVSNRHHSNNRWYSGSKFTFSKYAYLIGISIIWIILRTYDSSSGVITYVYARVISSGESSNKQNGEYQILKNYLLEFQRV